MRSFCTLLAAMLGLGVHAAAHGQYALSSVWANDGSDKVWRQELRASRGLDVRNTVWDGVTIKQFGARNEVVSFAVILESQEGADALSVSFQELESITGD